MSKKTGNGKGSWAFDDDASELQDICKRLASPAKGKDPLLKTLKALSQELEGAPQDVECLKNLGPSIASGLLACTEHTDKDVKLLTALCLTHVLRIYAPETPFTDDELKEVFRLLIWSVGRLENVGAPTFDMSLNILQLTEQVKFHLLLLDLDPQGLTTELFQVLLGCVREDNVETLEHSIVEVLSCLLVEAGSDVGDVLNDTLLASLLRALLGRLGPTTMKESSAQSRVAGELVMRAEDVLRPHLQRYLTCLINAGGAADEAKGAEGAAEQHIEALGQKAGKAHVAESAATARRTHFKAILKMYGLVPQLLLPVMPHVGAELESEEEARRKDAVHLVYQLLVSHDSDFAEQYPSLLDRFMKRYIDNRVDIRLFMLSHTASLAAAAPTEALRQQILSAAAGRLVDPTDSVRVAACKVVCEVAVADLSQASLHALEAVGRRLRDTSATVRNEAATGLMLVFRGFSTFVEQHGFSDSVSPLVLWIPGVLAWCCLHNGALRAHVMAALSNCSTGLFHPRVGAHTCAEIWVVAFDRAPELEQEALLKLLAMKCKSAAALSAYLTMRSRLKSKGEEQNRETLERRMGRLALGLLDCCSHADRATGQELLSKLSQVKDQKVFERLSALCNVATGAKQAAEARKDLLERLGSKTPLAEYMTSVLDMVRPTLMSPTQLQMMMGMLLPSAVEDDAATVEEDAVAGEDEGRGKGRCKAAKAKGPSGTTAPKAGPSPSRRARGVALALLPATRKLVGGCSKAAAALLGPSTAYLADLVMCSHTTLSKMLDADDQREARQAQAKGKGKMKRGRTDTDTDNEASAGAGNADGAVVDAESFTVMVKALARSTKLSQLPKEAAQKLATAMEQVCSSGPATAAKWAPFVLLHCLPPAQRQLSSRADTGGVHELSVLTKRLMQQLVPSAVCDVSTPAALQALCSIGWVAPEALGGHAGPLVDFVVHNFLCSDLPSTCDNSPASSCPSTSGKWGAPSASVGIKLGAIKGIARALCPLDGDTPVPTPCVNAACTLIRALEGLVDIENEMEDVGAVTEHEKGHVRLAAASALLRMGIRHDSRISPQVWVSLALTMQDPLTEVRTAFGAKLSRYVISQMQMGASRRMPRGAPAWLVTKYAALLPLAGMDPTAANMEAAARQLRDFTAFKRHSAQLQQQQEALRQVLEAEEEEVALAGPDGKKRSSGSSSGGGYPLHPEFVLPFVIYLLAHHPDVPEFGPGAESDSLQPFSIMLQLCLEPLLAPSGGGSGRGKGPHAATAAAAHRGGAHGGRGGATVAHGQDAAASLPMVLKALRHIRAMEDADKGQQAGEQIRGLCDLATELALAIGRRWTRRLVAQGTKGGHQRPKVAQITRQEQLSALTSYPDTIVLPKSLYQAPPGSAADPAPQLPSDFHPLLERSIRKAGGRVSMPEGMREEGPAHGERDGSESEEYDSGDEGGGRAGGPHGVDMEVDSVQPAGGAKRPGGPSANPPASHPNKKKTGQAEKTGSDVNHPAAHPNTKETGQAVKPPVNRPVAQPDTKKTGQTAKPGPAVPHAVNHPAHPSTKKKTGQVAKPGSTARPGGQAVKTGQAGKPGSAPSDATLHGGKAGLKKGNSEKGGSKAAAAAPTRNMPSRVTKRPTNLADGSSSEDSDY